MENKPKSKTTKGKSAIPTKSKIPGKNVASPASLNEDWKELQKHVMICAGNFSQTHKKFKGYSQQSAATCIVACVFSSLRPMSTWKREVLDEILEIGTKLYLKSRQVSDNRCLENMKPDKIDKYFYVNDNYITTHVGIDVMTERIPKSSTIIQNVATLLTNFLKKNRSGIFAFQNTYFAIWKMNNYLFLFDPTEHNEQGGKWNGLPGHGFCYCIRTSNIKHLAEIIIMNCPLKQIYNFTIYPCVLKKSEKVNTVPPETIEKRAPSPVPPPKVEPKKKVVKESRPKTPPQETPQPEEPKKSITSEQPAEGAPTQEPVEPKKSISKSLIPPERPKLESVTRFVPVFEGKAGILRASTHQRDPRFTRYMGAQSLSNAVAALTMLRQYKSKLWNRKFLDDILKLGEITHHDSKSLPKGEVPTKITLNDKAYSPKIDKYGCVGRLTTDEDKIIDLEHAITNTLIDTDCCILMGPNIVAIWKEDNRFYMFDPEERTDTGTSLLPGDPPGVACVTWYTKPVDLVTVYLSNVPKALHKDRFVLNKVTIKDYLPRAEDWYNFKALTRDKWILRGTFSQQDRRFPQDSRNSQCTANAAMALTYKELKEEKDWDDGTVDQILLSGDEFYHGCVDTLKQGGKFKDAYLMVDELNRNFDIEDKKVRLQIDECLVNGVLNAKSETGIPNIKKGFEEFFTESEGGVVTANYQSMAVWKKDDTYFYFDSHSRNAKGVVCSYGTACIVRMLSIEDLSNLLMTNVLSDTRNYYNISRVIVKLMDMSEDGVVKPPLNFYETVNEFIAILRSNTNEKDKKFDINVGKQTVPMCLAALAFNALIPSFDWSKEDLDQVLTFGDQLYKETMEDLYSQEPPEESDDDVVTTNNVKKQLKIGANAFDMELEDVSTGNLEENLKEAIEGLSLRVAEEGNDVFQSILESELLTVSMWRDDNLFYLFDSRPRDEKGQVYGKDDWSAKIIIEFDEDEMGSEEEEEEEGDEMAGGDNLGPAVPPQTTYEEGNKNDDEDDDEDEDDEDDEDAPKIEKKGSEFWRKKSEEGKACVLRFSRIEDLIKHIIDNAPPNRRQEMEFTLKSVKVNNTPVLHELLDPEVEEKPDEIAGDWNEFKETDYGKWILRSKKNFNDELFPACNRGKQAVPMCMVAIAYASLYALSKFKQDTVDSILTYGDRLYTVMRKLRIKEYKENADLRLTDEEIEMILGGTTFTIAEYPKNMCMGDNLATWDCKMEVVLGDITSKEPENVPNVTSGLTTFFEENKFGILICKDYPVAVWKDEDVFYMFDPHPNGPSGAKSPIGVSCITRFINLDDLVQLYLNNLPKLGNHFFEIHALTYTKDKCVRERSPEIKEEKVPKIGGFNQVMAGKSILRGDVKLDCTKFDRGVHVHSAAIAFVALALSLSKESDTWTRLIVNEILAFGEELHNDTVDRLGTRFNPWKGKLDVARVNTDFKLGSLKVNCAFRFKEQRGIVDVKNAKVPNLRQGIERFFKENSHGIIVADKFMLPIWEQMKGEEISIYMYDPNSRGATGLPSQGGTACVMKFCNATVASDHIKACMMDINKARTEFAIVPVEIVIDTAATKRKVCKPLPSTTDVLKPPCEPCKDKTATSKPGPSGITSRKTGVTATKVQPSSFKASKLPTKTPLGVTKTKPVQPEKVTTMLKKPPCPLPTTVKPATCPDKEAVSEEKRAMRIKAEEERKREEAKRCWLLGREAMYQINNDEAIIRAYNAVPPDRALPVNIAAMILMKITKDLTEWTYKDLERVIEIGYQLYIDSYNAYKPSSTRLQLQHILRRILIGDCEIKIDLRKPVICGSFAKAIILAQVSHMFTVSNVCFLAYEYYLVTLYFKGGYYYLFDPYPRDLNGNKSETGSAVLLRFGSLEGLADKLLKNLGPQQEPPKHFAIISGGIVSAVKLTKK